MVVDQIYYALMYSAHASYEINDNNKVISNDVIYRFFFSCQVFSNDKSNGIYL